MNKKTIICRLSPELHKLLKQKVLDKDTSIQEVVEKCILNFTKEDIKK